MQWPGFTAHSEGVSASHPALDASDDAFAALRERMVEEQIVRRGVKDPRVIAAMRRVPRHLFVEGDQRDHAYEDRALPIACGQTISQPYVVAFLVEALQLPGDARVLDIGTGSGYQAAVLGRVAAQVYTIEIVPQLAAFAQPRLRGRNIECACGDGGVGWADHAPFDGILVAAAAPRVPPTLLEQLSPRGCLIMPLGEAGGDQRLTRLTRQARGFREEELLPVSFVPLTGPSAQ